MLGSPNQPIRLIFKFSCLPLLAEIAAKICEPTREGRKIQKYGSKRLFHDTSGGTFRSIISYQESIIASFEDIWQSKLSQNVETLIMIIYEQFFFKRPNLPFLSILEVHNPSFPPFLVFFEKSSNYDTKFVYFLTKTFSCCYLCCFGLKNVVSTFN